MAIRQQPFPTGDAFIVQTPNLDQVDDKLFRRGMLLYQMQQQRDAVQRKADQDMDSDMMKQLGNVKNADIPKINDLYSDYKRAKQAVYFDKGLQNNPKAYSQAQIDANEKLGNLMQAINVSSERKNFLANLNKDQKVHSHLYNPQFGPTWQAAMNAPTDPNDPYGDPNTYLWGGPKTNLAKLDQIAQGKPQSRFTSIRPIGTEGIQEGHTEHKFAASPLEYFNSYANQLASDPQAADDAARLYRSLPQETIDQVNRAYDMSPADKWQAATGKPNPQAIVPQHPDSDAEKFAAFQAKNYWLSHEPTNEKEYLKTIKEKEDKYKNQLTTERQMQLARYRAGVVKDNIHLRHDLKGKTEQEQLDSIDNIITGVEERGAKANKPIETADGEIVGHIVEPLPVLKDALEGTMGKEKVNPDLIIKMKNGDFKGVFYARDPETNAPKKTEDGKFIISDKIEPTVLPREGLKTQMQKNILTKSGAEKAMGTKSKEVDIQSLRNKYGY